MRALARPWHLALSIACTMACGAKTPLLEGDAASDVSARDAAVDAPSNDAVAACPGTATDVVTLSTFETTNAEPDTLAIVSPWAYVGVFQLDKVDRVPLDGGVPTSIAVKDWLDGTIASDGARLYYPSFDPTPSANMAVGAYDLATGAVEKLPNPTFVPADPAPVYVADLAAAPKGELGVFFLLTRTRGEGLVHDSMLVRAKGDSATQVGTASTMLYSLRVGARFAAAQANGGIYAMPLSGGDAVLRAPLASSHAALLAVASDVAFFTPDGASIERLDLATGTSTTIVTGVSIERCGFCEQPAAFADDTWLYYVNWQPGGESVSILRVPIAGGASETMWNAPNAAVFALAVDACRLYWLSSGPNWSAPVLRARGL